MFGAVYAQCMYLAAASSFLLFTSGDKLIFGFQIDIFIPLMWIRSNIFDIVNKWLADLYSTFLTVAICHVRGNGNHHVNCVCMLSTLPWVCAQSVSTRCIVFAQRIWLLSLVFRRRHTIRLLQPKNTKKDWTSGGVVVTKVNYFMDGIRGPVYRILSFGFHLTMTTLFDCNIFPLFGIYWKIIFRYAVLICMT